MDPVEVDTRLKEWTDRLGKGVMPALSTVIRDLKRLVADDETSINQLADVILKDASLTSQILKVANCPLYNPAHFSITTITRAIVLIGFEAVKHICISVAIIDSLLSKKPRELLLASLARSFHAAVQAQSLCKRMGNLAQEEAFVAALLFHLSEMAFWSIGDKQVDTLANALKQYPDKDPDVLSQEILGVKFKDITLELAKQWGMGKVLLDALEPSEKVNPKVEAVRLGEEISRVSEKGWDSPEMTELMSRVAKFTHTPEEYVKQKIMANADEAANVADTYGAPRKVTAYIPKGLTETNTDDLAIARGVILEAGAEFECVDSVSERAAAMNPDDQLQLSIIRDLTSMLATKLDINLLFQTVLEGMHRGVALERVAMLLLNPARDQIKVKYLLGIETDNWRELFVLPIDVKQKKDILSLVVTAREAVWIGRKETANLNLMCTPELDDIVGKGEFFLAPVVAKNREIGLFYADRRISQRPLQQAQFIAFQHFVQQANLCLAMMTAK